jgi:hypothetical protein
MATRLAPAAVRLPAQSQAAHRVAIRIRSNDCKESKPRPPPCLSIEPLQPWPEHAIPIDRNDARGMSKGDLTNEWRLRPDERLKVAPHVSRHGPGPPPSSSLLQEAEVVLPAGSAVSTHANEPPPMVDCSEPR